MRTTLPVDHEHNFASCVVGATQWGFTLWLGSATGDWTFMALGAVSAITGLLVIVFERRLASIPFRGATGLASTPACYMAAGLYLIGAMHALDSVRILVTRVCSSWVYSSPFEEMPIIYPQN